MNSLGYSGDMDHQGRLSLGVLGLVLSVHALALWALAANRHNVAELVEHPILVSLMTPQPEAEPAKSQPDAHPPQVIKPAVKPLRKRFEPQPQPQREEVVTQPEPQLVAQAPASNPAPAAEAPAAVAEVEVPPQPDPVAGKPAETAPPEEPIEQPRFNADYLDNPAPGYPALSRKLREEGRVLLRVRVDAEGRPAQVMLYQSSGFGRLDERAAETVKRWRFIPARQGGKPVEAWVIVPIQFSLKG